MRRDGCVLAECQPPRPHQRLRQLLPLRLLLPLPLPLLLLLRRRQHRTRLLLPQLPPLPQRPRPRLLPRRQDLSPTSRTFPPGCASKPAITSSSPVSSSRVAGTSELSFAASGLHSLRLV